MYTEGKMAEFKRAFSDAFTPERIEALRDGISRISVGIRSLKDMLRNQK